LEQAPIAETLVVKSPKSVALPVVAMVMELIMLTFVELPIAKNSQLLELEQAAPAL
jgi:hypothetical protein